MPLTRNLITIQDFSSLDYTCGAGKLRITFPLLTDNLNGTYTWTRPSDGLNVLINTVTPIVVNDSGSIDFTLTGDGSPGNPWTITGSVIYSADPGNVAVAGTDGGIYVPAGGSVLTLISYDPATHEISYTDENAVVTVLDLDTGVLSYTALTNTLTYTAEDGVVTNVALNNISVTNVIAGNRIATVTNELNVAVDIDETITTVAYDPVTGILTYTAEGGAVTNINLPLENFLASASFNDLTNDLTLTLADASTVVVNLEELINPYDILAGDTNCIDMTVTDNGNGTVTVSAVPILNPSATNFLTCTPTGLLAEGTIGRLTNVVAGADTANESDLLVYNSTTSQWEPWDVISTPLDCINLTP